MKIDEQNDAVEVAVGALTPLVHMSSTGFVTLAKPFEKGAETGGIVVIAVLCSSRRQFQGMFSAMFESPVTNALGAIRAATAPPVRVFDDSGRECFWAKTEEA